MKPLLAFFFLAIILSSCIENDEPDLQKKAHAHIQYFGFTLIDTFWDDPTDPDPKMNYADEIHSFTNLADMLVVSPADNVSERLTYFESLDLQAVLHCNELFFELKNTEAPSGANYDIREDYQERWQEFKRTNQAVLNKDFVGVFYIGEEPTWNGISFAELNVVAQLLQADFPNIPTLVVEAYPSLADLQIPASVDWVGFDQYFIKDPTSSVAFQRDWQTLKSKLSNPNQSIMVIMDSHYLDWAHGDLGEINLTEMGEVASNYFELAKSDERVIGILGYFWPNGFDFPESVGARGMPENVKMEYMRIGGLVTEKSN